MKKSIEILLVPLAIAAFCAFQACYEDEDAPERNNANRDLYILPDGGSDEDIDTLVFTVINLDYPGLERVKEFYEAGDYYYAAYYLLEYFRTGHAVFDHEIDTFLLTPSATASQTNMADQALEENGYRFYVKNFAESTDETTGLETYYSFLAEDGSIDWEVNPDGVIENGVVNQEWSSQKHRHQWMLPQAKVYRATGNESYASSWITVYSDWLEAYPWPEEGESVTSNNLPWYGLQPASRLIDQSQMFPCYIHSESFTPEWLCTYLVAFAATANCIRNNLYSDVTHNIYQTQQQALFRAAVLMPEFADADAWLDESTAAITALVESEFNDDGVLVELDPSYHIGVVANFYDIYVLAQENGYVSYLPSTYVESLRNAVQFIKDIVYPNYSIDNYNDTRSSSWTRSVLTRNFGYYSEMFPDDAELVWWATGGSGGSAPTGNIQKYATSGFYMMRTGWNSSDMMMVLKNHNYTTSHWHCQRDNCTFTLYRNGRRFSPDAGCYTYDEGSTRETYRRANLHNTLVKESGEVDNTLGKLLLQGSGDGYECLVIENPHYSDLSHRRAVFLVDNSFFVIVDEGYGTFEGTLCLHMKGWDPEGNKLADIHSMDNLDQNGSTGTFDSSLPCGMHSTYSDSNNMIFLTFPETTDGYYGYWNTQYFSDTLLERTQRRIYTVELNKAAELAARFITVLYPFGSTSEYDSIDIDASFTDNADLTPGAFHEDGASVSVTIGDKTYNLSYSLNN